MTAVNHRVSKALVTRYGAQTLFGGEDLTGIRGATSGSGGAIATRPCRGRFISSARCSNTKRPWTQACIVAAEPRYTSQTCPQCGHLARGNRDKRPRRFACQACHYRSNDDRIGALTLHRQGIEYRVTGATAAGPPS